MIFLMFSLQQSADKRYAKYVIAHVLFYCRTVSWFLRNLKVELANYIKKFVQNLYTNEQLSQIIKK